jgi:hypothetical protein
LRGRLQRRGAQRNDERASLVGAKLTIREPVLAEKCLRRERRYGMLTFSVELQLSYIFVYVF